MPPDLEFILLLSQLIIAAAMTGIIWVVQLVVYPQFFNVSESDFKVYHAKHSTGIVYLVAPLMLLEAALSIFAAWHFRDSPNWILIILASTLTLALWLITFLCQVPLHGRLKENWSKDDISRLISTNWIRTWLWTLRLSLLIFLLIEI